MTFSYWAEGPLVFLTLRPPNSLEEGIVISCRCTTLRSGLLRHSLNTIHRRSDRYYLCDYCLFIVIYHRVNCKSCLTWSFLEDGVANRGEVSHTNAELSAELPFPALRVWHNHLVCFLK